MNLEKIDLGVAQHCQFALNPIYEWHGDLFLNESKNYLNKKERPS